MNILVKTLCHIRNAQQAKKVYTTVSFSTLSWRVLQILHMNGYIDGFTRKEQTIFVFLRYFKDQKTIKKIHRISTPTKRVYMSLKKLTTNQQGLGLLILSTSKGLLSDAHAKQHQLGGEVLCSVF